MQMLVQQLDWGIIFIVFSILTDSTLVSQYSIGQILYTTNLN